MSDYEETGRKHPKKEVKKGLPTLEITTRVFPWLKETEKIVLSQVIGSDGKTPGYISSCIPNDNHHDLCRIAKGLTDEDTDRVNKLLNTHAPKIICNEPSGRLLQRNCEVFDQ
jgi:hypothetical protein